MKVTSKNLYEAAKHYVREGECEVMDTFQAHEDTFKAGAKWAAQKYYWDFVYREPGSCPTLEAFLKSEGFE